MNTENMDIDINQVLTINRIFPGFYDLVAAQGFYYTDFEEACVILAARFAEVLQMQKRKDAGTLRVELEFIDFPAEIKKLQAVVMAIVAKSEEYVS